MQNKLLTIIIPIYNVEQYIARCLDSIYNQKVDETLFEVIAINDGSPDNSLQIVEEYQEAHNNLIIHTKKNGGLSSARNKGIELATGKYVWFVDSDDWITNDSLKVVFETITKNYDVISTTLIYSYDDNSKNCIERELQSDLIILPYDYILNYSLGASQRYIIKYEYLKKNNLYFYPGILHEDGEFGPRLIAPCKEVYMLATPIYHYYQRENGSIMSSWKLKNSKDATFIASRTLEYSATFTEQKIRESLIYASFRTLMFAFGNNCRENKEINEFYKKTKPLIRKMALKVLLTKSISKNKRLLAFVSLISPSLYYKFRR